MARKLSISRAWDESREVLGRDGRLIATVALALLVLPSTVQTMVTPEAPPGQLPEPGPWMIVALIAILVTIVGQLAVIRLALGPPTTVGEAIGHGARRAPALLAALLMWVLPMVALMIALARSMRPPDPSPAAALALLVLLIVLVYLAVRLILVTPVAGAEKIGPVAILKRSWGLTRGSWWRLFGFLLLFLVAAVVVMLASAALIGLFVRIVMGAPEPMSVGALIIALATHLAIAAVTTVFLVMLARIYLQSTGPGPVEASVPSSGT